MPIETQLIVLGLLRYMVYGVAGISLGWALYQVSLWFRSDIR